MCVIAYLEAQNQTLIWISSITYGTKILSDSNYFRAFIDENLYNDLENLTDTSS